MYYNYHAKAQSLIKDGHFVKMEVVSNWNNIKPALVLYFDNHKPMPIRQEKWQIYFDLIKKDNNIFENQHIK